LRNFIFLFENKQDDGPQETSKQTSHMYSVGLSGKFVLILKENLNVEDLNFSIHLLYLNLLRPELSGQPNTYHTYKIL